MARRSSPASVARLRPRTPDDPVTAYARAVVAGEVPAGRWHRAACARHLWDLAESAAGRSPYVYDRARVEDAVAFFRLLRHFKGPLDGQPFALMPWQVFVLGSIIGWRDRAGHRRVRNAFLELCRGQGKSTFAAGVLLLLAFYDGEAGAEGYCVATKRDQARIVFRAARRMVLSSSALRRDIRVLQHSLWVEETESHVQPLGADADTLDGLRPHIAVIDEVHRHASPDLIEVMESGMGTRTQPLLLMLTTAGASDAATTAYGQQLAISRQVLEGYDRGADVPEWFAFIASADPEDDPGDERTWQKANPNYGVSISPDFLRKEWHKVRLNPYERAKFERYYLGRRIGDETTFFDLSAWDEAPAFPDEEALRAVPCWIGLDLSSSVDLTACAVLWRLPTHWAVKLWCWVPGEGLDDRARRDRAPYPTWAQQGWLRVTAGNVIDRETIYAGVRELVQQYRPRAVAYDPWHASEITQRLQDRDRVTVIEVPQRIGLLSTATLAARDAIQARELAHDRNPILRWMLGNVVVREDDQGHVMPIKRRSRGRIDGVQAMVTAWAVAKGRESTSVYRQRPTPLL